MGSLLEASGRLGLCSSQGLIPLDFELGPGTRALEILFDYRPRTLSPERSRPLVSWAVKEYLGQDASPCEQEEVLARSGVVSAIKGVRNLLNLALYDPSGRFRGRWDLNLEPRPLPVVVADRRASPGFFPGPLPPGGGACSSRSTGSSRTPVSIVSR